MRCSRWPAAAVARSARPACWPSGCRQSRGARRVSRAGAQGGTSPRGDRRGKVVRVRDGDSIVVMRGGVGIEVRLDGIDCPGAGAGVRQEGEKVHLRPRLREDRPPRRQGEGPLRQGACRGLPPRRPLAQPRAGCGGLRLVVSQILDRPDPGVPGAGGPHGAPRALGRIRTRCRPWDFRANDQRRPEQVPEVGRSGRRSGPARRIAAALHGG